MDTKDSASALRYDNGKVRFSLLPHDVIGLIMDKVVEVNKPSDPIDKIILNNNHDNIVNYLSENLIYFWQKDNNIDDDDIILNLTYDFMIYIANKRGISIYNIFLEVAAVLEFGATKYDVDNWKKGFAFSRIYNSLMRHLLVDFISIDSVDSESGLKTYAHILCNLFFLIWHLINRSDLDDRPE